jgi:hypothetical protein
LAAQTVLHPPQLLRSVAGLMQAGMGLPQAICPVGHLTVQMLPMHSRPAAQAIPHWPQLAGSLVTGMQTPLHSSAPTPHAQLPPMQACIAGHTIPHRPQLAGSRERFTQADPQRSEPGAHAQFPSWHARGGGHAWSQPPQCSALLLIAAHTPPHLA